MTLIPSFTDTGYDFQQGASPLSSLSQSRSYFQSIIKKVEQPPGILLRDGEFEITFIRPLNEDLDGFLLSGNFKCRISAAVKVLKLMYHSTIKRLARSLKSARRGF